MFIRSRIWAAVLLAVFVLPMADGTAQRVSAASKKHGIEKTRKDADEKDEDDDDDTSQAVKNTDKQRARQDKDHDEDHPQQGEPVNEAPVDEGEDGVPPLPVHAPSRVKRSTEPFGPVAPPPTWTDAEISEAKSACARLLPDGAYEYKALEPIKEGACGAAAPVRLSYINHVPRIEIRPVATMTCPLADALDRWLREVVQPRAKALLDANVIRLVNLAAYQCRNRYNSPNERISYHAYAQAIDIGEFVTAKGEHITVLEHWPLSDERSRFLHEVHDGACKIFGTVLGPGANAAHKNHFHLDLAPRRHSSYCQ